MRDATSRPADEGERAGEAQDASSVSIGIERAVSLRNLRRHSGIIHQQGDIRFQRLALACIR
jgi:hypothetical protein